MPKGGRRRKTYEEIVCHRKGCGNIFKKKVHNQKFCSKECCRIATNEKLLLRYYDNKRPVDEGRICASIDCTTILSKYNKDQFCGACKLKREVAVLRKES